MGQGLWGKEGQMAGREGMAGCMRARWQLLGVVGLAWSRSLRWWASRDQIRGKGQLEARKEQQWPVGVEHCRQDGGSGALGWDTRHRMGWGCRHMMGFQTGVGSSNVVGYQTQVRYQIGMMGYQIGMVGYQIGMVGYQTGRGISDAGDGIPDASYGIPDVGRAPDMG